MIATAPNRSAACLLACAFDADLVRQAARGCLDNLRGDPDLVLAFVTSDYRPHVKELVEILQIDGHAPRVIGGSGSGLIGRGKEVENASCLSLLFLKLPRTRIDRDHGESANLSHERNGTDDPTSVLCLAHPLTCDLELFDDTLGKAPGETVILGGLVSGGPEADDLFLFDEGGMRDSPVAWTRLSGGIHCRPFVAQSCRPIGEPFVVTGATANRLESVGQREAFAVLEEAFQSIPESERDGAGGSVFAGLAIEEEVEEFDVGDFLVRRIVGGDLDRGRLHLTGRPRVGQTMQFQLRDPAAAGTALREECERVRTAAGEPLAAILFAGRERGQSFYGAGDQDISVFADVFPDTPVAGLFANGEIGPVAGRNCRHDHALCGALLYSPPTDSPATPREPSSAETG